MLNLRVFKEPSFLIAVVISICLYLISMGSAVFNTIRQISGSLASTMAVLIYTLAGSDINAIRVVYIYYGIVTVVIIVSVILYLKVESNQ